MHIKQVAGVRRSSVFYFLRQAHDIGLGLVAKKIKFSGKPTDKQLASVLPYFELAEQLIDDADQRRTGKTEAPLNPSFGSTRTKLQKVTTLSPVSISARMQGGRRWRGWWREGRNCLEKSF